MTNYSLTVVTLAVSFLTVDDIKAVRHSGHHTADLKIKPLIVCRGVDVGVED